MHTVDYEAETRAGLAMRELIEAESRTSGRSSPSCARRPSASTGRPGYLTTAADTERRRIEWVQAELVKAGTERARSLGWTDVYTFTKALGERVVADVGRDIQVSMVRPAIVESSWRHPYPGWIEGFKMAEPLILAYGRGELPEFPASPDSVVDIVPCDHVVNAILAVCATTPEIGEPEYYHVNSGARNPLTFRDLYGHIRDYFTGAPARGRPPRSGRCRSGSSPVRPRSSGCCRPPSEPHAGRAPWSPAPRARSGPEEFARDLDRPASDWTSSPLPVAVQRVRAVRAALRRRQHPGPDNRLLHPDDQAAFAFDTAVFDW